MRTGCDRREGARPGGCALAPLSVAKGAWAWACVRAQASPSSPLPSTLACLTTFRTLGVEEWPACSCSCSWKARVLLATRAALLRATTDWRDFRAGQDPLWACRPPSAFES